MSQDTYRIATVEDAPELLTLIQTSFQEVKDLGINWPSTNLTLEPLIENIKSAAMFVLERDGRLIATLTVRFPWEVDDSPSGYPFVWWFATLNEYRGQGVGNLLLKYVEETFLRDTLKSAAIVLGTSARKHPWLLDMYRRKGYEIFYQHEEDGDVGVLLYKVLIPEFFNRETLEQYVKHLTFD